MTQRGICSGGLSGYTPRGPKADADTDADGKVWRDVDSQAVRRAGSSCWGDGVGWGRIVNVLLMGRAAQAGQAKQTKKVADLVEAREFRVVGKDGKVRAGLTVSDDVAGLALLGKDGKAGITLGTLGVTPDGTTTGLSLLGQDGKVRCTLGSTPDNGAGMGLWDKDGNAAAVLGFESDGTPRVELTDKDGKVLWEKP